MSRKKIAKMNATERTLLWFALALCMMIAGYNLFFAKDFSSSGLILTTQSAPPVSSDSGEQPRQTESPASEAGVPAVVQTDGSQKLNLNEATATELAAVLPGVGEVLAARIIEYRESKGGFNHLEELLEVNGIGDATFAAIQEYLTIE